VTDARRYRPVTWTDRVAYPLLTWAVALTMADAPAILMLALCYRGRLPPDVTWLLMIPPVALDVCSAYLSTVHLLRGGRHGQALLSWLCYVPLSVFGANGAWWWRVLTLLGLTVFHACCQSFVPLVVARRLGWQPEGNVRRRTGT
jgi:hypothetical protein